MLLSNQGITKEIEEEIKKKKKQKKKNDNENMMTQSLWEKAKAVPRGKFIEIQSYFKK